MISVIKILLLSGFKRIAKALLRFVIFAFSTLFPTSYETYKVKKGYKIREILRKKYGRDAIIFLMRGASGDAFLICEFLPYYLKEHKIDRYVLTGNTTGLEQIANLFHIENVSRLSRWQTSCLQSFYKFNNCAEREIIDLFLWQHTMYFNRCRIRMHERFTFMDTYQWYVFGFSEKKEPLLPEFCQFTEQDKEKWNKYGIIENKTIIIAPNAYSITKLPCAFWEKIDSELHSIGWETFYLINPQKEFPPFKKAKTIWFSYFESVGLLNYAGGFLSLRNGLCDIVSSSKCRMVILYPSRLSVKNYNEHRSDMCFCGLKAMGLNDNVTEIETPLLRNTDISLNSMSRNISDLEMKLLEQKIIKSFII